MTQRNNQKKTPKKTFSYHIPIWIGEKIDEICSRYHGPGEVAAAALLNFIERSHDDRKDMVNRFKETEFIGFNEREISNISLKRSGTAENAVEDETVAASRSTARGNIQRKRKPAKAR